MSQLAVALLTSRSNQLEYLWFFFRFTCSVLFSPQTACRETRGPRSAIQNSGGFRFVLMFRVSCISTALFS